MGALSGDAKIADGDIVGDLVCKGAGLGDVRRRVGARLRFLLRCMGREVSDGLRDWFCNVGVCNKGSCRIAAGDILQEVKNGYSQRDGITKATKNLNVGSNTEQRST